MPQIPVDPEEAEQSPHSSAITTDSVASQKTYGQSNVEIAMYRFIFPSCSPITAHPVPCLLAGDLRLSDQAELSPQDWTQVPPWLSLAMYLALITHIYQAHAYWLSRGCPTTPGLCPCSALPVAYMTVQHFWPTIVCPTSGAFPHKETLSKKESEEIRCGLQTEFLNDFLIRRSDCQMLFVFA